MLEVRPWRKYGGRDLVSAASWRAEALCGPDAAGDDWLLFVGRSGAATRERLIKEYCQKCPVIAQCRKWADGEESFCGVAGGREYHVGVGGKTVKHAD